MVRNAHLNAIRSLPARRRTLFVAEHVAVVTGAGNDETRIQRELLASVCLFFDQLLLACGNIGIANDGASNFG